MSHVLTFGKYKGATIADILDADPNYLLWLHNNCDFFELDNALLEEVECAINPNDAFSRREVERAVGRLSDFMGE